LLFPHELGVSARRERKEFLTLSVRPKYCCYLGD